MKTTIPEDAYWFRAATQAQVGTPEGSQDGPRKFSGIAYTGKALRHPYWGTLAIDVETTTANALTPILLNHDSDRRVGMGVLTFDGQIAIEDGTLLGNEFGKSVAEESDAGFPWQMSVHITPGSIEEIQSGATGEVNGQTVHGPAAIWRNNFIREVSFTPIGVDYHTTARALSAPASAPEVHDMTIEELTAQIAEMKASAETQAAALSAAEARATAAEEALAAASKAARLSAVQDLFKATGTEFSDEAAAPYLDMSDAVFSAVSTQIKGMAKASNPALFSDQGGQGRNPAGDQGAGADADDEMLSAAQIYDLRRA